MGKRFDRIKQAAKLQSAQTHYIQHLTNPTATVHNVETNRPARTEVFVLPFNVGIATGEFIRAFANAALQSSHGSAVTAYQTATLATGNKAILLAGFTPARANVSVPGATAKKVATSKLTGQTYIAYGRTSSSLPFGQAATPTTEGLAFISVAEAIKEGSTTTRVYLIGEKFRAVS